MIIWPEACNLYENLRPKANGDKNVDNDMSRRWKWSSDENDVNLVDDWDACKNEWDEVC